MLFRFVVYLYSSFTFIYLYERFIVLGYKISFDFDIGVFGVLHKTTGIDYCNCHIYCYDSHLLGAERMILNYNDYTKLADISLKYMAFMKESSIDAFQHTIDVACSNPKLVINPDKTDFFSISIDDILVDNYVPMENIKFDVAV